MASKQSMITLNMCDFCSHERSECGAQPVLVDSLNLDNLDSDQKHSVVACDKYVSPVVCAQRKIPRPQPVGIITTIPAFFKHTNARF